MSDVAEAAEALTAELVAIDSVNSLVPGAAGETEIVRHLRARLGRAGFTTHVLQAVASGRPSLVAVGPGSSGDPTVVLNGHLDTVGVTGMPAPFAPVRDGERLSGRGAADMKGAWRHWSRRPRRSWPPQPRSASCWRWSPTRRTPAGAARRSSRRCRRWASDRTSVSSVSPPISRSPGRCAGSR